MTWDVMCRMCGEYMDYGVRTIDGQKRYAAWCTNPECMADYAEPGEEGSLKKPACTCGHERSQHDKDGMCVHQHAPGEYCPCDEYKEAKRKREVLA